MLFGDHRVTRNLCHVSAVFLSNRHRPQRFDDASLEPGRDITCGARDLDQIIHVMNVQECIVLGFFW